jgi:hypothetical protein
VTDLGLTRGTDIAYDCIHFWSHHLVVKTGYFAEMKAYHLSYVVTSSSVLGRGREFKVVLYLFFLGIIIRTLTWGTESLPSSGITCSGPSCLWKSSRLCGGSDMTTSIKASAGRKRRLERSVIDVDDDGLCYNLSFLVCTQLYTFHQ